MKRILVLFVSGLLMTTAVGFSALQDQDDVRGAFLVSRPKEQRKPSNSTARPSRRKPRNTSTTPSDPKNTSSSSSTSSTSTKPGKESTKPQPINAPRIGLGFTLFMRDTNGLAIRTDPTHVFQKGDRVRVLLETNADGYLYIFNTTNDGPAVMLYPHPELDEAGNYLQAHVPFEIPSSLATEERLRWLAFDENAGDERLFFVFSREPLSGVPTEDELINLCRDTKDACPWRPSPELWTMIQNEIAQPVKTDRAKSYGAPQTERELQANARGLGLAKEDPQPSWIMMSSSARPTLVTTLDLIHK